MIINIIIVTIFLVLLLICILPSEVLVILVKLLLLNMQICFSSVYYIFHNDNKLISYFLEYFCGVKKSTNVNTLIDINFESNKINIFVENPKSSDFVDQFDFSILIERIIEFFLVYNWLFLPIILYFLIIYFLHAFLGLYSAYVDYFQKNPDHLTSMRAFLPAVFIFYFIIFIIFVGIIYFFKLYLFKILWFLFI